MHRSEQGTRPESKRGDPNRIASRSVLRLTDGSKRFAEEKEGRGLSEQETAIQSLLVAQLDTSKESITRRVVKEFEAGSTFQPLDIVGSRSLGEFQHLQTQQQLLHNLREAGLTDGDIVLKLGPQEARRLFEEADPLRRSGSASTRALKGKHGADPDVSKERIQAIKKLVEAGKADTTEANDPHSEAVGTSSRADLQENTILKKRKRNTPNWSFPEEIMPSHIEYQVDAMLKGNKPTASDSSYGDDVGSRGDGNREECIDESIPPKLAKIEPLPLQLIQKHKKSLSELKEMERFKDYSPGEPSNVLYVKNLHPKVTEGDLVALFGNFPGRGGNPATIQLMKGRMRGQAFIQLESVEVAERAMALVNGYEMRGRPVVVLFAKQKSSALEKITRQDKS